MRRLACLLVLLLSSSLWAGNRPELVIGSWNLQNYLLQIRFPEGRFRPDYPMPEAQKAGIRRILLEERPDILFLQELGSAAFLLELQLDLAAAGLDYPFSGFSGSPDSRSGLAFLSVLPAQSVLFHDPLPAAPDLSVPRGVQEVTFSHKGRSLCFFHVHLKSRYSSDPADPDSTRARQAGILALQAFLDRQLRSSRASTTALVGDFNTPDPSPLLEPLHSAWLRLRPVGQDGLAFTYSHRKSGARELLDGFWNLRSSPVPLAPLRLLPAASQPCPSDHRLVLVAWDPFLPD